MSVRGLVSPAASGGLALSPPPVPAVSVESNVALLELFHDCGCPSSRECVCYIYDEGCGNCGECLRNRAYLKETGAKGTRVCKLAAAN